MGKFMYNDLVIDNTNARVSHCVSDYENEMKAIVDWSSKSSKIHFECGYREFGIYNQWTDKKGDERESAFITAIVQFLDQRGNTIYTNVLTTRDYTNEPTLKYLSRTGLRNKVIRRDSPEFYSTLNKVTELLDDEQMDNTTATILKYLLNKMHEQNSEICECPKFLKDLVKLGYQQRQQRIKETNLTTSI